jgi:isopenicillin-N N-acyltransferase-like protein
MDEIRVLEMKGSYYDMGYLHGKTYADEIRMFAEERVELSGNGQWTGRKLAREEVLGIAEACLLEHEAYSPQLMEEFRGMADGSGVSLAELVVVSGFTDFVDTLYAVARVVEPVVDVNPADNCTAFLIPNGKAQGGQGYFGQTWDMHASATPFVIMLRVMPDDAPSALVFTITGCVGMIGMNNAGISIGINNLLGGDGQIGVTWNFVIRKALMQTNIEDALACITEAKLAGAHNYLLMDKHGNGYNVEAMSSYQHITKLEGETISHTNHCVIDKTISLGRERVKESQIHSEKRLQTATELLQKDNITLADLQQLTRDYPVCTRADSPEAIETCGAAIMQPATGKFWALWGLPDEGEYVEMRV